jgi:hypothetical protein
MADDNKIIAELVLEGAETFQANLKKASDTSVVEKEFKDMGNAIDLAKKKLATLTPGTSAFKKLENEIKASEIATKSFAGGMDSLKKQLRDATANMQIMNSQLAEMKKQGLQGTSAFKALENGLKQAKQEVGDLKDEIGDLNAETSSLGSDTRGLDTMIRTLNIGASVFGAVQGAQALFGIESEDLQKKLVQLNAIMAISNGLQQIQEELTRRDSIAKKAAAVATSIYTAVVGTSTGAMKLFKIALASTGIGLLIVGVGILVANFQKIKTYIENLLPSVGDLGKKFTDVKEKVFDFINKGVFNLINGFIDVYNKSLLLREGLRLIGATVVSIKDIFVLQFKQIGTVVTTVFDAIKAGLRGENPFDVLKKGFDNLSKNIGDTGKKVVDNFKKPIAGELSKIKEFDLFPSSTKSKQAGEKVGKEIGEGIGQGITKGVEDNFSLVDAIFRTTEEAKKYLEDFLKDLVLENIELGIDPQTDEAIITVVNQIKELNKKLENEENQLKLLFAVPEIPEPKTSEGGKVEKVREKAVGKQSGVGSFFGFSEGDELIDKQVKGAQTIFGIQQDLGNLALNASKLRADKEVQILEDKRRRGLISEKKYQNELNKIKNEQAKKQRRADIIQAFLAVPLAFLQGLKDGGLPAAFIASALALAQATIVASAPVPKFKEGGLFKGSGFVRGRSHNLGGVNAELEGGEFVVKRKAVKKFGVGFLKDINDLKKPSVLFNEKDYQTNREINQFNLNFAKIEDKLSLLNSYTREGNSNSYKEVEQLRLLNEKIKLNRGY